MPLKNPGVWGKAPSFCSLFYISKFQFTVNQHTITTHALDQGFNLSKYEGFAINIETVKNNFRRFDLLDERVKFIPGWFKDTLRKAPVEKLALLRIDADMYESTIEALSALYPKLESGGYLIVDDYGFFPPCKYAVDAYRTRHKITEPITWVDESAIYWKIK
ncbi:MAG: putative O-methyltransferase, partial [Candidatus Brocadiaceae bacterium]|nr:putative O-methyltransferase [Candidatus Brocadiaceae bacterium]MBM2834355.1 putative O-methyltransferase [Candidatus Brocadiaceae bacterium]